MSDLVEEPAEEPVKEQPQEQPPVEPPQEQEDSLAATQDPKDELDALGEHLKEAVVRPVLEAVDTYKRKAQRVFDSILANLEDGDSKPGKGS